MGSVRKNKKDSNNLCTKFLSKEEEKEILIKIKNGDIELRNQFVMDNIDLIRSIAKKYYAVGLDFEDLVQEGVIAFIIAIENFDFDKDVKFVAYAYPCINLSIRRSIENKSNTIRIPVGIHEKINLYRRVEIELGNELMRTPTIKEIAERMKKSVKYVERLKYLQSNYLVSMNTHINNDDGTTLEEFISIEIDTPEEEIIAASISDVVEQLLHKSGLTDRQIQVIKYRFGFYNKPLTLEEVAEKLNVKRERARQIEAAAFIKLRRSKYLKEISLYMDFPEQAMKEVEEFNKIYSPNRKYKKIHKKNS